MSDLGLSFGRTFPLIRTEVSALLHAFSAGEDIESTMVANLKIPAAKGYCRRAGLVYNEWQPTLFGEQVIANDPNLVRPETLWLLHYFLSAPHYSTPNFWGDLVINKLGLGEILNSDAIKRRIAEYAIIATGRSQSDSTLDSAAASFLGTYAKKTALYELGVFPERVDKNGESKEQAGQYQMSSPQPIPSAAFACILADYWQANFPNTASIDEEQLTQSDLPRLLLLGVDGFNAKLAELSTPQRGLVQRQRRFNPPQLLRRWTDLTAFWDNLYA